MYWADRDDEPAVAGLAVTALPGFPARAELAERYAGRSGRDLSQLPYYVAFAHWRLACILEGVHARYATGAMGSADPATVGRVRAGRRARRATGTRRARRAVVETRAVIAVLGGGQLGRMLGLAGIPLGARFRFLDPTPAAPARAVGDLVVGELGDERALLEVTEGADVVTYEWEGVPADAARFLGARLPVHPGSRSLEVSQDRLVEKETFGSLGIRTPAFRAVDSRAALSDAVAAVGLPAVLKTRRGGYDGKGQAVLRDAPDVDAAWEQHVGLPLILEALVPFERELSVVAVRSRDGEIACWPVVENDHRDGILRATRAPAPDLDPALSDRAYGIATQLLTELDHVGVLAIELFEHRGELLANELAPRVHNSGHWTIEGAVTSQFENHVRAVLGLPLGATDPRGVAAMVNCIGAMPDPAAVLAIRGAHLHDYGKAARPDRKLGHVTVVADTPDDLETRLSLVRSLVLASPERVERVPTAPKRMPERSPSRRGARRSRRR